MIEQEQSSNRGQKIVDLLVNNRHILPIMPQIYSILIHLHKNSDSFVHQILLQFSDSFEHKKSEKSDYGTSESYQSFLWQIWEILCLGTLRSTLLPPMKEILCLGTFCSTLLPPIRAILCSGTLHSTLLPPMQMTNESGKHMWRRGWDLCGHAMHLLAGPRIFHQKLGLHQNAACENDVNVWCRRVTEARQTAFGCATNVWQIAELYPSTVGTSKRIRIQYTYM